MGIGVMVMGASGSGKTASLRNFSEEEIGILSVSGKPLPFRKKLKKADNVGYREIEKVLSNPKLKRYAIDDSQYLMAFESFDKAKEVGYAKYTDMAIHFSNLLRKTITETPPDVVVYFLHHTEETEAGRVKAKTIGKMLDNQLTIEGLFSIVLLARTDNGRYYFETQSDGYTTAKSPMEMFPSREIDNDLKAVDEAIRDYYELDK